MENGLERFLKAHHTHYRTVLQEIRSGKRNVIGFQKVLDQFFQGEKDRKTVEILKKQESAV